MSIILDGGVKLPDIPTSYTTEVDGAPDLASLPYHVIFAFESSVSAISVALASTNLPLSRISLQEEESTVNDGLYPDKDGDIGAGVEEEQIVFWLYNSASDMWQEYYITGVTANAGFVWLVPEDGTNGYTMVAIDSGDAVLSNMSLIWSDYNIAAITSIDAENQVVLSYGAEPFFLSCVGKYETLADLFTAIAAKIKSKRGLTEEEKIIAEDFPEEIDAISTGGDFSQATLNSSNQMLEGVVGYGVDGAVIEGNIPTVPYSSPAISVSESGAILVDCVQEAGYCEGTRSQFQKALNTIDGIEITPSAEDQVAVPANHYTLGEITVLGDTNLTNENIRSGVSIFGVDGEYSGNTIIEYLDTSNVSVSGTEIVITAENNIVDLLGVGVDLFQYEDATMYAVCSIGSTDSTNGIHYTCVGVDADGPWFRENTSDCSVLGKSITISIPSVFDGVFTSSAIQGGFIAYSI